MERPFSDMTRPAPQAATRARRCRRGMHPDIPATNLRGFSNMAAIMSFCANKPLNMGGAYKL